MLAPAVPAAAAPAGTASASSATTRQRRGASQPPAHPAGGQVGGSGGGSPPCGSEGRSSPASGGVGGGRRLLPGGGTVLPGAPKPLASNSRSSPPCEREDRCRSPRSQRRRTAGQGCCRSHSGHPRARGTGLRCGCSRRWRSHRRSGRTRRSRRRTGETRTAAARRSPTSARRPGPASASAPRSRSSPRASAPERRPSDATISQIPGMMIRMKPIVISTVERIAEPQQRARAGGSRTRATLATAVWRPR